MSVDFDPEELEFATGEELVTGVCKPCKQGRHLDCRSVGATEDADSVWPFFPDETPREPTESPFASWVCGCLLMAEVKRDLAKHHGVTE